VPVIFEVTPLSVNVTVLEVPGTTFPELLQSPFRLILVFAADISRTLAAAIDRSPSTIRVSAADKVKFSPPDMARSADATQANGVLIAQNNKITKVFLKIQTSLIIT
jgi:hypothetical protein